MKREFSSEDPESIMYKLSATRMDKKAVKGRREFCNFEVACFCRGFEILRGEKNFDGTRSFEIRAQKKKISINTAR